MNRPTEEHRLNDSFDRLAAGANVPPAGRARVSARLVVRRRRRRAAALATVAVVAGGIGVGVTQLPNSKPDLVAKVDTTKGQTPAAAPPANVPDQGPAAGTDPLPKLTIDLAGMPLTRADISAGLGASTEIPPDDPASHSYFQSFRSSPDDWQPPAVSIYTAPPGATFSIGDEGGADSTVDINGNQGHLRSADRPDDRTLGWRLPDGTGVYVAAYGIGQDDLLALARSMEPREGNQGWTVSGLPPGLVPVIDEANRPRTDHASHSLQFGAGDDAIELDSSSSTASAFEEHVLGSLDSANDVENTSVRGQPAVIVRSANHTRVFWYEPDNNIENYVTLNGATQTRVDEVIARLTELPSNSWDDLLASAETTYWDGDTPSSTPPPHD